MTHRILVVDDEPDITALVAYHLAKAGFRVSTASTGPDALKAARDERPDIVILDLMLPGISGYDVLEELLSLGQNRRWRREMIGHATTQDPKVVLDVATGTAGSIWLAGSRNVTA